ncbi:MAG: diguanylate cyclase domain-containing protein [Pseudomonadota bacterium]
MANLRAEAVQAHDREIDRLEGLVSSGHRLLRFPRDLEREFENEYAQRYLAYRRRVVLLAVFVVLGAGLLDLVFVHGAINQALLFRYGVIAPAALAILVFSRTRWFASRQQPVLALFTMLLAGLLFGLMRLGDEQVVLIYSPGFLLIAVFAGMLLHLRFWLALLLIAAVGVAYVAFVGHWRPQSTEIVAAYTIFYLTGALMALFAGYGIEHTARRQFLHGRLLALKQNELELANHQLQELVDQDGLTGIANRRHFDHQFDAEWSRARRGGYPLSLLLIDLDFFKNYNDTYGHQAGDDCLIVVGSVLRAHTQRSGDVAARYGGEEFAMILPATTREDAEEIGWRVVRDIAAYRIPHQASDIADVVTASVGVACVVPSPMVTPRDLLAAADNALYRAKRNGRNRVEVAGEDLQPVPVAFS